MSKCATGVGLDARSLPCEQGVEGDIELLCALCEVELDEQTLEHVPVAATGDEHARDVTHRSPALLTVATALEA